MRKFSVLVLVALVLSACGQSDEDPVARDSSQAAVGQVEVPAPAFDDVPAFGRTEASILRDDTIALWEAWRRQQLVASCMEGAGFTYFVDFQYPEADIAHIKDSLGLTGPGPEDGSRLNRDVRDGLDDLRLDDYYRTLYDVSLKEVQAERGDFRGGCTGSAWTQVRSVWDARDAVAVDLVSLNKELQSGADMEPARAAFEKCADSVGLAGVSSPEEAESAPVETKTLAVVLSTCSDDYNQALAETQADRARQFEEAHPEIGAQRAKYSGVLDRIRSDEQFLDALGR